jgi:ribosomal protein S8
MNIPEINEVKSVLIKLKADGYIGNWELPYENLLTRRSAAIFFLTPSLEEYEEKIWSELSGFENFSSRLNSEKKLSQLKWRITFSHEELEKNRLTKNGPVVDSL